MDCVIVRFNANVEQYNKANSIWEFDFVMALQTVDNVKPMCRLCSCQIAGGYTIQSHLFLCACVWGENYKKQVEVRHIDTAFKTVT